MLALTTCISWRNAGRQRNRGRLVKPRQQPKPRWQQLQYPHQGGWVDKTAQVFTTSDICLGGAGQEPSISCEGHTSLLQGGQARCFGRQTQGTWRGGSKGRGLPLQTQSWATPQPKARSPQQEQGVVKANKCWQCGGVGHLKHDCPTLKGKGLFQGGNA